MTQKSVEGLQCQRVPGDHVRAAQVEVERITMKLTINGESRDVGDGATVLALLEELGFRPEVTVVERNAGILERANYGGITLADGDTLEIVRFVGGG